MDTAVGALLPSNREPPVTHASQPALPRPLAPIRTGPRAMGRGVPRVSAVRSQHSRELECPLAAQGRGAAVGTTSRSTLIDPRHALKRDVDFAARQPSRDRRTSPILAVRDSSRARLTTVGPDPRALVCPGLLAILRPDTGSRDHPALPPECLPSDPDPVTEQGRSAATAPCPPRPNGAPGPSRRQGFPALRLPTLRSVLECSGCARQTCGFTR